MWCKSSHLRTMRQMRVRLLLRTRSKLRNMWRSAPGSKDIMILRLLMNRWPKRQDKKRSPLFDVVITKAMTMCQNAVSFYQTATSSSSWTWDMDNWKSFLCRLRGNLPDNAFVWIFFGGSTNWIEPKE